MGQFRDYLNEAKNKQVPTEFRIALGQLKRMYNAGEVPEKKELEKDVEMIAKKNDLDADKFLEFAIAEFKLNEAKMTSKEFIEDAEAYVKNIEHTDPKDKKLFSTKVINRLKEKRNKATGNAKEELIKAIAELEDMNESEDLSEAKITKSDSGKYTLVNGVIQITKKELAKIHKDYKSNNTILTMIGGITTACPFTINESEDLSEKVKDKSVITDLIDIINIYHSHSDNNEGKKLALKLKSILIDEKLDESAVGTPGRTTVKDAEEHINDELMAEFKKIIKKLGGKTVAKVLLDKLSQKVEIKDEIEHIEDIIDNSNY